MNRRLLALTASLSLAPILAGGMALAQASTGEAAQHAISTRSAAPISVPASFADLVARVSPAVVSIDVTSRVPVSELARDGENPFTVTPKSGSGESAEPTTKAEALCSGFFIASSGSLVTNNHCVRNVTSLKVTLKDGRELPGKVVGTDQPTDLAVIKVEGSGFPFIDFADAARPRVGDWAIAIGNPFGLSGTATAGIVSSSGREIGSSFNDFIQVDTPINKGNSGGPTFDTSGRVIGVNTIIFSESGDSVGIGFAIPAETAQSITAELIAKGHITRGYLGATIQNLTPDLASSVGLVGRKGAIIAEVTPSAPAQRAGLQSGDVVLAIDRHQLTSSADLTRQVAMTRSGQTFELDIYRDRQERKVRVTSGLRPSEQQLAEADTSGVAPQDDTLKSRSSSLGMSLGVLDEGTRRRLGGADGVIIKKVDQDSEAAEKGLQPGIVVFQAGDQRVHAPVDVANAVASARRAGRDSILLGVRAEGRTAFLALKLTGQG